VGAKASPLRIATAHALSKYFEGDIDGAWEVLQVAGQHAPDTFRKQGLKIAKEAIYADLKSKRDPKKQAMPGVDSIHEYGAAASRLWLALIDRLDKSCEDVRGEGETLEIAAARLWRNAEGTELGYRRSADEIGEMDFGSLARHESQRKTGRIAPQPEKKSGGWFSGLLGNR